MAKAAKRAMNLPTFFRRAVRLSSSFAILVINGGGSVMALLSSDRLRHWNFFSNRLMLMFLLFCHTSKKRAAIRRTSYPQNYERRWVIEGYQSVNRGLAVRWPPVGRDFWTQKEGWGLVLSSLWYSAGTRYLFRRSKNSRLVSPAWRMMLLMMCLGRSKRAW
jgi:hypothetical protein